MKFKFLTVLATTALAASAFAGNMRDPRDGKTYRTVQIGNQTWMAENLNYKTSDSKCYDSKENNCDKYGRLYVWSEKMVANVCPSGWHLPSKGEFETLLKNVGGANKAGTALKSRSGWNANGNGRDEYGFGALPAGLYRSYYDIFDREGGLANFWSSTEDGYSAYILSLLYYEGALMSTNDKSYGFSVRCVKNSNEEREASLARPSGAGTGTAQKSNRMIDSRDGKTYKTVKIGNQTWMAENLNYKTSDSKCYDSKESNCDTYGRLYVWSEKMVASVCPSGWHLPSKGEFVTLLRNVGGERTAGTALKSRSGWNEGGNGSDEYGFGALPAGSYNSYNHFFNFEGYSANFWSSTEDDSRYAYRLHLFCNNEYASMNYDNKNDGFSVRCVKNSNEEGEASLARPSGAGAVTAQNLGTGSRYNEGRTITDYRDGKTYRTVQIGNQTWMAENLNYKTSDSKCYDSKESNCDTYGRLYVWSEKMVANVCPSGWHLPSKGEFETLLRNVGGKDVAGTALKSSSGWNVKGNGRDEYGFGALPAGNYDSYRDYFHSEGDNAYFWSSTEGSSLRANYLSLFYYYESADMIYGYKDVGFSVRCVKNSNEEREASLARPSGAGAVTAQNLGTGSRYNEGRTITDYRDGKTYRTVQIGNQTWMAENLNYETSDSKCYKNNESNCDKYGRLYVWDDAQNVCPSGWHLPSMSEFKTLLRNVGGENTAGIALKSRGGWIDYNGKNGNGRDEYGFGALPAGCYGGDFDAEGIYARFWSSTEEGIAFSLLLDNDFELARVGSRNKREAFSVRCVKNN